MRKIRIETTPQGEFVYEDRCLASGVIWSSKLISSPLKERKQQFILKLTEIIVEGLIVITFILAAL